MTRAGLLLLLLLAAGCQCRKSEGFQPPSDAVLLPIADRQWAVGAPAEGWCGETSIQMTALHYGAWLPQPAINSLGRSTHVDLWEEDIPTALDRLGLSYERAQVSSRDEFVSWIIGQVRRGYPVIVGSKLFPSDHPDWDVDHLMPVVGFSPRGLTFNTNVEWGQLEVRYAALGGQEGISFASPTAKYYGFAILGFRDAGPRVTLRVLEESVDSIKLAVQVGAGSWVLRRDGLDGGVSTGPLTSAVELKPSEAARFTVLPATPQP